MLEWLILLLGIPLGYLLAWLASDELEIGRRYFRWLIVVSFVGFIGFWIYGWRVEAWSMGFVGIVGLVSFLKSKS